ncbi:isocitrate lyase/phosphoenolpyruvate mutase family protein [Catellatospora bangladeshensis]|uniref:isocitrate lyase/phosphoenolpyruvate mutase family protein n=1 Tax=Catellatospora bangladeshensis TaxID=310355 RepID=UPI003614694B
MPRGSCPRSAARRCSPTPTPVTATRCRPWTARRYAAAGISGLHLEDQVQPKRCGHLAGKELIGADAAARKIRAVTGDGTGLVVVARTDAYSVNGLDDAIARAAPTRRPGPTRSSSKACPTSTNSPTPTPRCPASRWSSTAPRQPGPPHAVRRAQTTARQTATQKLPRKPRSCRPHRRPCRPARTPTRRQANIARRLTTSVLYPQRRSCGPRTQTSPRSACGSCCTRLRPCSPRCAPPPTPTPRSPPPATPRASTGWPGPPSPPWSARTTRWPSTPDTPSSEENT